MAHLLGDQGAIVLRAGRVVVVALIGDAKPATQVEAADVMAIGAQKFCELGNLFIGHPIGRQIRQLRADMHINAHNLQPRQTRRHGIDLAGPRNWDAKFVFFFTRRNFRMGFGIHIGIDPNGDGRSFAQHGCHLRQRAHFRLAFHIELPHAAGQNLDHFRAGLAHARKDNAIARNARSTGAGVFTT